METRLSEEAKGTGEQDARLPEAMARYGAVLMTHRCGNIQGTLQHLVNDRAALSWVLSGRVGPERF